MKTLINVRILNVASASTKYDADFNYAFDDVVFNYDCMTIAYYHY